MRPLIGLIPLYDEKLESIWMLPEYQKLIEQAGGIPVVLPLTTDEETLIQLCEQLDGLLLTGGHDVNPALYGEEKRPECQVLCEIRDKMEISLIKLFLKTDKPIFGICRGLQILNVYFGGSLYQDIPTQFATDLVHSMPKPYDQGIHQVTLYADTPLYELLQTGELSVNSRHHQAIKDLAPDLVAMAQATDGLIEAVYHPDYLFVWAVQWHPEHMYQSTVSKQLAQKFIQACRDREKL
ncbi:gamma-glutamyl-gamma-aminobutyrate hydrolase family protein [Enterococcus cecorum]|uniref:gamma-glutamyl-gamma-aminobutyrate hydrolase family protein n=1 Tax=Enterococcus cecorum TaxID=44008 RepID=UPI0025A40BA3|nr:gamma-glutamyl-gamma-aminobutyrate hydrolase family protein [Enterococcus cecorum]MDM8182760.1 gamma-glutamyl-gamma-aminobutyrate hydrolase family protein [Enterococcus cecorum]